MGQKADDHNQILNIKQMPNTITVALCLEHKYQCQAPSVNLDVSTCHLPLSGDPLVNWLTLMLNIFCNAEMSRYFDVIRFFATKISKLRKEFVGTSKWLSGLELDAALKLIHHQWPDVVVQPVIFIQLPRHFGAAVKCGHGDYVQILHMDKENHWVAVTNIADKGQVRLFDSLNMKISHRIKRAIASQYYYLAVKF